MQDLRERLSGYDLKHEVDSHVTKCSVGSYMEIVENNIDLNPLYRSPSQSSLQSKPPLNKMVDD